MQWPGDCVSPPPAPAQWITRVGMGVSETRVTTAEGNSMAVFDRAAWQRKRRAETHEYLRSLKAWLGCIDCGTHDNPENMDFDHVRGTKAFAISKYTACKRSTLDAELAKCVVRCHGCHSRRHEHFRLHPERRWQHGNQCPKVRNTQGQFA